MSKTIVYFIDDDKVEHLKINRTIEQLNLSVTLNSFTNPIEAVETLKKNKHALPQLIILDLNMPEMNGFEVLDHLKKDFELKKISVVILTTSEHPSDIDRSFEKQVSGYFVKPGALTDYNQMIKTMSMYWSMSKVAS